MTFLLRLCPTVSWQDVSRQAIEPSGRVFTKEENQHFFFLQNLDWTLFFFQSMTGVTGAKKFTYLQTSTFSHWVCLIGCYHYVTSWKLFIVPSALINWTMASIYFFMPSHLAKYRRTCCECCHYHRKCCLVRNVWDYYKNGRVVSCCIKE